MTGREGIRKESAVEETEALLKRVMPHSTEAEQSVVGAMLMDRDAVTVASEMLTADDFYQKQYGILFGAIVELYGENQPIDLITLQNRLREKDVPPEISSMEFMQGLLSLTYTSANVRGYAQIVAEKAQMRRLIKTSEEIAATCYAGKESVEVIMEDTEKKIFQVLQRKSGDDFTPIKEVVLNALDKIEAASRTKGSVTGLATGFIDLDYKTSGFQPSDLLLIAARPSMGKTAFVLNIAEYMAFHNHLTVAVFSLEMSKEQLVNRLFAMESRVESQALRTGNLNDSEWANLIEAAGTIGRSNLIIDDTPGISVSELRSKCRKYKLEHNLDIIMIDYLQLMTGSRRADSRQQEISDISRSLKEIARELQVPVVALSQLSRAVEQRPDHRPMLSDLRESGAIEQDADVVMFIYRDDYYNHDTQKKDVAEIIISKQRNGPIGTVELAWLPRFTKFANMKK
ncbi:MAG: replicative DNA helicase [Clostridiales bacterium]|nr:replicative DNA helicase [Clostridiales bacterium]